MNQDEERIERLVPTCRYAWMTGLTDYPIEEHVRDCLTCQEYQAEITAQTMETPDV